MNRGLVRVSRRKPCPICGKDHWCSVSADGTWCICMREGRGAAKRTRNGGWLHRLADSPGPRRNPDVQRPTPVPSAPRADFLSLAERLYRCADHERIAKWLGFGVDSLRALRTGWNESKRAYAWPMRDWRMRVIGIRYRASRGDARKWAERGSQAGLFIPRCDVSEPVVICEGPTDTLAAIEVGAYAIGRPSNTGGHHHVVRFLLAQGISRVVIVPDSDRRGTAGGYLTDEAACRLRSDLSGHGIDVRIVRPPRGHDLRDLLRSGSGDVIRERFFVS